MTWFPCCLQAYIWFVQFWMICGNCCHCKCKPCKFLAVPIAVKSNSKDIFNDGKKKQAKQAGDDKIDPLNNHEAAQQYFNPFGGFEDENDFLVHRGYAANMELN